MSEAREPVLPIGAHTLRLAGRTLEQAMGAVWQAIIETHGYDPAEGWEVVLQGATLRRRRETPAPPEGGVTEGTDGAVAPAAGAPG